MELCEEIGLEEVQLANFEFFSSTFRDFRVDGANLILSAPAHSAPDTLSPTSVLSYSPSAHWTPLGSFTASNVRGLQSFRLSQTRWFRHIRVTILSHYDSEFYCPISEFRALGLPLAERLKMEIERDFSEAQKFEEESKGSQNRPSSAASPLSTDPSPPILLSAMDQELFPALLEIMSKTNQTGSIRIEPHPEPGSHLPSTSPSSPSDSPSPSALPGPIPLALVPSQGLADPLPVPPSSPPSPMRQADSPSTTANTGTIIQQLSSMSPPLVLTECK